MRRYRDKCLTHLDSDRVMDIPRLDTAQRAMWFYYAHIWAHEIDPIHRSDAPEHLDTFYQERLAAGVYAYEDTG